MRRGGGWELYMIMIIGGFAQGKADYAVNNYENAEERMFRLNEYAREVFDKGGDFAGSVLDYVRDNPQAIIVTDEVGRGVVPIEKSERDFRERLGRLQCELAKRADEVIRVTCGLGVRIK